jgi:hypothetical protein
MRKRRRCRRREASACPGEVGSGSPIEDMRTVHNCSRLEPLKSQSCHPQMIALRATRLVQAGSPQAGKIGGRRSPTALPIHSGSLTMRPRGGSAADSYVGDDGQLMPAPFPLARPRTTANARTANEPPPTNSGWQLPRDLATRRRRVRCGPSCQSGEVMVRRAAGLSRRAAPPRRPQSVARPPPPARSPAADTTARGFP